MTSALRLPLLAAVITTVAFSCPSSEWLWYGGMCYWASNATLHWNEVRYTCQSQFPGADMVSIHDIELDAFLAETLLDGTAAWIGLRRVSESEPWLWTDGTTYDYSNWFGRDPECTVDDCCGLINYVNGNDGSWSGYSCSINNFPYICQIRAS